MTVVIYALFHSSLLFSSTFHYCFLLLFSPLLSSRLFFPAFPSHLLCSALLWSYIMLHYIYPMYVTSCYIGAICIKICHVTAIYITLLQCNQGYILYLHYVMQYMLLAELMFCQCSYVLLHQTISVMPMNFTFCYINAIYVSLHYLNVISIMSLFMHFVTSHMPGIHGTFC